MTTSLKQHVPDTKHCINFEKTRILAVDKVKPTISGVLEMERHPNITNQRDDIKTLPRIWIHLIKIIELTLSKLNISLTENTRKSEK